MPTERAASAGPQARHDDRVVITILTGFLGSGKTTLLEKLSSTSRVKEVGIIVNEFSTLGIDQMVIGAPQQDMRLLAGDCICCLPSDDLAATLRSFRVSKDAGSRIRRVVIETSGLAEPGPLIKTVVSDSDIAKDFRLGGIVTTVDAVNARETLDNHAVAVNQVAAADLILLTKPDLEESTACDKIMLRLRQLNPWAALRRTLQGEVERGRNGCASSSASDGEVFGFDAFGTGIRDRRDSEPASDERPRTHDHGDGVRRFEFVQRHAVRDAGLRLWMDMLAAYRGPKLLRMKGVINVEGRPVVVQAVQQTFHPPVELPAWPSADRTSRLVFITRGLTRNDLERTFTAFDFNLSDDGLAPDNYRRFITAMKGFRALPGSERI